MTSLIRPVTGRMSGSPASADGRPHWRRDYAARLILTDALALVWAVGGSLVINFGTKFVPVTGAGQLGPLANYWALGTSLVITWSLALGAVGSRGYRLIGTGSAEFKALFTSAGVMLVAISLVSFAL
jgi:hypothetical protein